MHSCKQTSLPPAQEYSEPEASTGYFELFLDGSGSKVVVVSAHLVVPLLSESALP